MKPDSISAQARQFERHTSEYAARIEPHPDHADQFRLSFADVQVGMAVIDVSEGGVGLRSGIFLPKNMRLTLIVSGVNKNSDQAGSVLMIRAVVRRCKLVDHNPTYHFGLQYTDSNGPDERALIQAVNRAKRKPEELSAVGEQGVT